MSGREYVREQIWNEPSLACARFAADGPSRAVVAVLRCFAADPVPRRGAVRVVFVLACDATQREVSQVAARIVVGFAVHAG